MVIMPSGVPADLGAGASLVTSCRSQFGGFALCRFLCCRAFSRAFRGFFFQAAPFRRHGQMLCRKRSTHLGDLGVIDFVYLQKPLAADDDECLIQRESQTSSGTYRATPTPEVFHESPVYSWRYARCPAVWTLLDTATDDPVPGRK